MTQQEKIDLVVSAIQKARTNYPAVCIKIEMTDKLKSIGKNSVLNILKNLEKDLILKVYDSKPNYRPRGITIGGAWHYDSKRRANIFIPSKPDASGPEIIVKDHSITIRLFDGKFDNWYSARQLQKKQKLEDLSSKNVEGIYKLVCEIKEKFETNNKPNMEFFTQGDPKDYLVFLYNKEALLQHDSKYLNTGILHKISLELNVKKFFEFAPKIKKVYKDLQAKKPKNLKYDQLVQKVVSDNPTSSPQQNKHTDQPLYSITFTLNNEILLNDLVLIGKPNLNSENGNIFPFIFDNPNRKVTKKEIENHLGLSIGKDLHKIVENWGFAGDLRKTFFKVSKDAIFFRNPITKADFEKLGVPPLKIVKK